ncbi:hypothetical protein KAJ83_00685 [Marivibrio halodurans]|uniref:PilZ domain-containing protein n=1 Tax=Marivibrio halodurans TaxID=2039722 RepID=A0A8J7RYT3_9PROT|nr:hypothetical protein [Marivibrio halodurans]MBP5855509.1 hypothetical protein [Marivibrio halodurans]
MSLFGGLFGARRGAEEREHDRAPGHGVRVRIDRNTYQVEDLSAVGFRINPYDGDLIARQQFTFRFQLVLNGESHDFPCQGYVVRIDENGLAAKYQRPQPYYQHVLVEFLRATARA